MKLKFKSATHAAPFRGSCARCPRGCPARLPLATTRMTSLSSLFTVTSILLYLAVGTSTSSIYFILSWQFLFSRFVYVPNRSGDRDCGLGVFETPAFPPEIAGKCLINIIALLTFHEPHLKFWWNYESVRDVIQYSNFQSILQFYEGVRGYLGSLLGRYRDFAGKSGSKVVSCITTARLFNCICLSWIVGHCLKINVNHIIHHKSWPITAYMTTICRELHHLPLLGSLPDLEFNVNNSRLRRRVCFICAWRIPLDPRKYPISKRISFDLL